MKIFGAIIDSLETPDAQKRDWYGWATNQMSHALLGVLVALFVGHGVAGIIVAMILAGIKEKLVDIKRAPGKATVKDSVVDVIFTGIGASIIVFGPLIGGSVLAISLLLGVYPRIRKVLRQN